MSSRPVFQAHECTEGYEQLSEHPQDSTNLTLHSQRTVLFLPSSYNYSQHLQLHLDQQSKRCKYLFSKPALKWDKVPVSEKQSLGT